MARLDERPFPPGDYPVVVVGSGPGGLQVAYSLRHLGVDAAVISSDEAPAGMFRRFPFFQRLITWTKPHAPVERGTRAFEWYDWNSLLAEEPHARALVVDQLDGTSVFPSRTEMERGLVAFVSQTGIQVRYGCTWEATRRDGDGFTLVTSDGEYRCRVAVFAVGMTREWKPDLPGMEQIPHYVDLRAPQEYAGKRIVVIGKRNSAFEIADGLLPWARRTVLVSPRPPRISIQVHSTAAARARYLQPYEDHVLGGKGVFVLDAAVNRVERTGDGWRTHVHATKTPGEFTLESDEVIAATGFATPLGDLPDLGVATFYQGGRLPAQTPMWESPSVPGIYFAGSITQGAIGLKKYGNPSNSAAVHGFRYNARVLAEHLAARHFGITIGRPPLQPAEVMPFLLSEASEAPELWNQQSYLARAVIVDRQQGIRDGGIVSLAHFVDDSAGPDAAAITVETDDSGDIHPAVYVRRAGTVQEHLLGSDPMLSFGSAEHQAQLAGALDGLLD